MNEWTGWEAETVERGSKALNERDAARRWTMVLESRLAEVRVSVSRLICVDASAYSCTCRRCSTLALIDAPLEATE